MSEQLEVGVLAGLDEMAALEEQLAQIEAPYRQRMAEAQAEMNAATAGLTYARDAVRESVRQGVLQLQHSVKGQKWHAVYVGGRVTWDSKGLEGFAVAVPEVLQFKKEGDPSVTFRQVK